MISQSKADGLVKRFQKLKSNRGNFQAWWDKIAKMNLPNKETFDTTKTEGEQYPTDVFNSIGQLYNQRFTAGLLGYLFNSGTRWAELEPKDAKLIDNLAVKQWFDKASEIMFSVISSSNFYTEIHECLLELVFGTAVLYMDGDDEDVVRFHARPLAESYLTEDSKGRVRTVFRKYTYTVEQAFDKWGKKAGKTVTEFYEKDALDERIEFLHVVMPRTTRNPEKTDNLNMPFASIYIELTENEVVQESGFHEFPYATPRLEKRPDEFYGHSQAAVALYDLQTLNDLTRITVVGGHKAVDPAIAFLSNDTSMPYRTTPGSQMVINPATLSGSGRFMESVPVGNIPFGLDLLNWYDERIKSIYFVDFFAILQQQSPSRTATEVAALVDEQIVFLSPLLSRLMNELLDPINIRTFNLCLRADKFPPMPPELKGAEYNIIYISPLARAMMFNQNKSVNNYIAYLRAIIEMFPTAIDNIDGDKLAKIGSKFHSVPAEIMRDEKKVLEIREIRALQEAEDRQLEQNNIEANTAKTATEAGKNAKEAQE